MLDRIKQMRKTQYFLCYSVLFAFLTFLFLRVFFLNEISFVWLSDGWNQHLKAYFYYSAWLKRIVNTFLAHNVFTVPQWDYSMGFGSDVITTLNYYGLGEPLTFLLLFVKQKNIPQFYNVLVIVRMYLAGLSFSLFCFTHKKENFLTVLLGSMIYVFSSYPMLFGLHHPFFLIPMIMLPLWCVGLEKIMRKESPVLFILSVFISLVSNFYFFYMTLLLFFLYFLFRFLSCWKRNNIKSAGILTLKTIGYGCIGCMIGAVIFLPVVFLFSRGSRNHIVYHYDLLYDLPFRQQIITDFGQIASLRYHTCLGFPLIVFLAVILLFFLRKHKQLKGAFILLTLFLCSPFAGHILNGFSYASNRWSFGYAFLVAFIVVVVLQDFLNRKKPFYIPKTVLVVFVVLFSFFQMNNNICDYYMTQKKAEEEYIRQDLIFPTLEQNPEKHIEKTKDFTRYSTFGDIVQRNLNILYQLPGTNFYWSLNDGIFDEAFRDFGITSSSYNYKDLNERTVLNALACVNQYVTSVSPNTNNVAPLGYRPGKRTKYYRYHTNQFPMHFGYTYDHQISEKQYKSLNMVEKEHSLLYGILPEDYQGNLPKVDFKATDQKVPYGKESSKDVQIDNKQWIVNKEGSSVTLRFQPLPVGETYLVANIQYERFDKEKIMEPVRIDVAAKKEDKTIKKNFKIFCKDSIRYDGKDDIAFMVGYGPINEITLMFTRPGIYTLNQLSIVKQPLEDYPSMIRKRNLEHMTRLQFYDNVFEGNIKVCSEKFLVVPIAYSDGWTSYVDGKEMKPYRCQKLFMGLPLKKGNHHIRFEYHTPFLKLGFILSLIGQLFLLSIILWRKCFYGKIIGNTAGI